MNGFLSLPYNTYWNSPNLSLFQIIIRALLAVGAEQTVSSKENACHENFSSKNTICKFRELVHV